MCYPHNVMLMSHIKRYTCILSHACIAHWYRWSSPKHKLAYSPSLPMVALKPAATILKPAATAVAACGMKNAHLTPREILRAQVRFALQGLHGS